MNLAGAVAIVASFSGVEPQCRLCGNYGASMTASGLPGLGDLLWRECTRCRHGWHEHPSTTDPRLPIGNHL